MVANVDETEDAFVDSNELTITKVALMLCVPFGASIGGVATLTGSDTNMILSGTLTTMFPEATPVSFAGWMIYAFPNSLVLFIVSYTYMQFFYYGMPKFGKAEKTEGEQRTENMIKRELKKLGPMRQDELIMTVVFIVTVLMWLFREPGFVAGWAQWFSQDENGNGYVSDATVAASMAVVCFMLPSVAIKFKTLGADESVHSKALLDWKSTQTTLPWGVLILLGGGFALAEASNDTWSGFASFVAGQLEILEPLPNWLICLLVSTISIFLTEFTGGN